MIVIALSIVYCMKGMTMELNSNYMTYCLQFYQKYLKKMDFVL